MSDDTLIDQPTPVPGPVKVQAKAKPPIGIEYADKVYTLPGRIPPEVLTAQNEIRRPTMQTAAQKADYEKQVGIAVVSVFFQKVLPLEFQEAIDLSDIDAVFEVWSNHVELGK